MIQLVGNIFEVAAAANDVAFGMFMLFVALGLFGLGYWLISWFIRKVCGNGPEDLK